jgi:predicted phosphodiesterase
MSKIGIISDIHGDLKATRHALKIIEEERCEKIICLGDVLDEGAENERIIQLLNQKKTICIKGNHEDIEQVKKTSLIKAYLDNCLAELTIGTFHFCHVINRVPELSIKNKYEAWNIFDEFPWKCTFIGHNHLPMLFIHDDKSIGECPQIEPIPGVSLKIIENTKYIVSVGSIAYGRDYHNRKSFVIYDTTTSSIDFHFFP